MFASKDPIIKKSIHKQKELFDEHDIVNKFPDVINSLTTFLLVKGIC